MYEQTVVWTCFFFFLALKRFFCVFSSIEEWLFGARAAVIAGVQVLYPLVSSAVKFSGKRGGLLPSGCCFWFFMRGENDTGYRCDTGMLNKDQSKVSFMQDLADNAAPAASMSDVKKKRKIKLIALGDSLGGMRISLFRHTWVLMQQYAEQAPNCITKRCGWSLPVWHYQDIG
jgi:hypothetical protein